jgi:hypothetical protein
MSGGGVTIILEKTMRPSMNITAPLPRDQSIRAKGAEFRSQVSTRSLGGKAEKPRGAVESDPGSGRRGQLRPLASLPLNVGAERVPLSSVLAPVVPRPRPPPPSGLCWESHTELDIFTGVGNICRPVTYSTFYPGTSCAAPTDAAHL